MIGRFLRNAPLQLFLQILITVNLISPCQAVFPPDATDQAAAGYTDLLNRLNPNPPPTGAGIFVTQVEAAVNGNSFIDTSLVTGEFNGKTIIGLPGNSGISNHANKVGRSLYGNLSFAPGISNIHIYDADLWLDHGFLNFDNNALPPAVETRDIQNHSWVGSYENTADDNEALQRLDMAIERDGFLAIVGVDNGSATPLPNLLSNAYNTISVGLSSGNSSSGKTTVGLDGSGRIKPDLVTPQSGVGDYSSFATPWVSATSALLLESNFGNLDAQQPESVKAAILAGATKTEFPSWSRSPTQPIDLTYGAGELNIDNAHRILTSLQQEASSFSVVNPTGWDYDNISPSADFSYFFDVPAGSTADLSALVTWNRDVAFNSGVLTPEIADINLNFSSSIGFTPQQLIDQSISGVDNIEHIYQTGLPEGRYVLELSADSWTDFAIAWDARLISAIPEPGSLLLLLAGWIFLAIFGYRQR